MTSPVSLTIGALFTPAESGVGGNPALPPASGSWLAQLLSIAATVGLPTTSWESGGPERTILAIAAVGLAQEDVIVSKTAQGGFLDFAATGFVSYLALNGTLVTSPVTPDPSIPAQNPTGAPGWLDLLGSSVYDEAREQATFASGPLALVNTTVATVGPFVAGTYHVGNRRTNATYANTSTLSLPTSRISGTGGVITSITVGIGSTLIVTQSSHGVSAGDVVYINGASGVTGINNVFGQVIDVPTATSMHIAVSTGGAWTSGGTLYKCTVASFRADAIGSASNAAPNEVVNPITQANGVGVANVVPWSAANYESNVKYASRCRLKLAALSPDGASEAYEFFALSAQSKLGAQTPPITLTNGPIIAAKTTMTPGTGVVTTTIASETPASITLGGNVTPGCSLLNIIDATNASPINIQTISAHALITGDTATITGVLGNTAANGTWTITRVDSTHFTLNTSVGNGTYTGAGVVEGGDLGQVDLLLQNNVVPDGVQAITQSALALPVSITATVVVPQAFATTYIDAVGPAVTAYLATLPIGGNIPPGGSGGTIPLSAISALLFEIGIQTLGGISYVRQVTNLKINGVAADLDYPTSQYQAILGANSITVVGI